jgi:hypothetical protein
MGLFSGSKKDHRAQAAKLARAAEHEAAEAKKFKAEAEKVRQREKTALYPDPAATRAIIRDLEANRRICELNAKELRRDAAEMERLAKKWF